jgi:hypothetical protein
MMIYIRLGSLCAIHVEWARALRITPLFVMERFNGEVIFDLPFCRLIYTPGRRINKRTGSRNDEKGNHCLSESAARAAED